MATDREVILADFQACTDIDDVAEAIHHLEGTNWDLLAAINKVMPEGTQKLPSEIRADVEMIQEIEASAPVYNKPEKSNSVQTERPFGLRSLNNLRTAERSENQPGTSRSMLSIEVQYKTKYVTVHLPEVATIRDLKMQLADITSVPLCKQELKGWRKEPTSDSDSVKDHIIPFCRTLELTQEDAIGDSYLDKNELSNRLASIYTLNVRDEIHNKTYNLKFPGTHTILEVKTDVYSLIDVPVRNQVWKGWPVSLKDDNTILAQSGINYPEHDLSVSKNVVKDKNKEFIDLVESDSSAEEIEDGDDFEDASESFQMEDDVFIDNVVSKKPQHLMSENVEDDTAGTLQFSQEFEKRYGPVHPNFFVGTFEEAVSEAFVPKEKKLLAVYLHHDSSILTHVFCTQLLGSEAVLQLLSANFIVYGWDMTHKPNENRFLNSLQETLGIMVRMAVQNVDIDTMPLLLILVSNKISMETFTVIRGNVGVNDLLTSLVETIDVFQEHRQNELQFEEERLARERVKQEQDKAYQESLDADRAKEEAKQLQVQMQRQMREQEESLRLAQEAKREAHRQAIMSSLPPEPTSDVGVIKVRVRLPTNIPDKNILERKFFNNTPLQILLNYLIVEGFPTDEYKVISSWPRRDLTTVDSSKTLIELQFHPQETLILEER